MKTKQAGIGTTLGICGAMLVSVSAWAQESPQVAPAPPPTTNEKPADAGAKPDTDVAPAKPAPALPASDQDFLRKAAAMHATGSELAKLTVENAGTEEVQALGQELLAEHTRSIAALREIAKMKDMELEASPTATQQATISEFAGKIGKTFDDAYKAQAMSNHHEAILLFSGAAKTGRDADVRSFAERSLGDIKDRYAAMGGEAVKVKGEMVLQLPKPSKTNAKTSNAKPATTKGAKPVTVQNKGKLSPVAAAALAPVPVAPAEAAVPAIPTEVPGTPASSSATSALATTAPGVAPAAPTPNVPPAGAALAAERPAPGRATANAMPLRPNSSAALIARESGIEVSEDRDPIVPDSDVRIIDPRARWTVPADIAPEPPRRVSRPREVGTRPVNRPVSVPEERDVAAAPVARVVIQGSRATPGSRQSPVVVERPATERRIIIRQQPTRAFRIFNGDDDDDE